MTDKKHFSVSQIAKIFGISEQTVRFYHKRNLLIPEQVSENAYRKYGYAQIYTLAQICYLRKAGLSIADISDFFQLSDVDKSIQYFHHLIEGLNDRCKELQNIIKRLSYRTSFLEGALKHVQQDLSKVKLEWLPERYYIPLGDELTAEGNDLCIQFPSIACYHSLSQTMYTVDFGAYLQQQKPYEFQNNPRFYTLPKQRYLTYYHKGSYSMVRDKILELRKAYTQYRFANESYVVNIVDQFVELNPSNYIVHIQIPLLEQ